MRSMDFGAAPTVEEVALTDEPYAIMARITIATAPGMLRLPSSHAQPVEAHVWNRSGGLVTVLPGTRDRIEELDIDEPVVLADGEDLMACLRDTSILPPPRRWRCSVRRLVVGKKR